MIPSDHISFNGDGTAWWVGNEWAISNPPQPSPTASRLDRPCDTCDGDGQYIEIDCTDCDGTGRHTFTVDTYCEQQCDVYPCKWKHNSTCSGGTRTLRVSVVPGMVLPIIDPGPGSTWPDCTFITPRGFIVQFRGDSWDNTQDRITLPPAAAPGMWAVKLQVAT